MEIIGGTPKFFFKEEEYKKRQPINNFVFFIGNGNLGLALEDQELTHQLQNNAEENVGEGPANENQPGHQRISQG